jgi:ATP-dependent RNA helicase DHX8/PRP22
VYCDLSPYLSVPPALQDNQEEFEIDLNDDEPEFLKGHSSRSGIEMSPVKIVKNPEGSMQRAAMTAVSAAAA